MPVFTSRVGLAPDWCEMEYFEIVTLPAGTTHVFERLGRREKLIVAGGECRIGVAGSIVDAQEGANLDLAAGGERFEVLEVLAAATLVRLCGRWGDETGGSGIFGVQATDRPNDAGDPVDYPKNTSLDNHFHDCDEYWIILEGCGAAVSEGRHYQIGPGDCVATGMGHHHDLAVIHEPIRGVYFETTLEGRKRRGHLWEHTHGPAEPLPERV